MPAKKKGRKKNNKRNKQSKAAPQSNEDKENPSSTTNSLQGLTLEADAPSIDESAMDHQAQATLALEETFEPTKAKIEHMILVDNDTKLGEELDLLQKAIQDSKKLNAKYLRSATPHLAECLQKGDIDCTGLGHYVAESCQRSPDGSGIIPFGRIQADITMAGLEIEQDFSNVYRDCWECGKLCGKVVATCSGCQAANYCGQKCQGKAWKSGHKLKCKTLAIHFASFNESLELLETTHSGSGKASSATAESADYFVFSAAFYQETPKPFPVGPSMKYFYENMERILNEDWWILCEYPSMEAYEYPSMEAYKRELKIHGIDWKFERLMFHKLARILCCDLVEFHRPFVPLLRRDNPGALDHLTDYEVISFMNTNAMGFFDERHPRKSRVMMPRERFIDMYKAGNGLSDEQTKYWSRSKRQLKKQVMQDFRNVHHK